MKISSKNPATCLGLVSLLFIIAIVVVSCSGNHLIKNSAYRSAANNIFEQKRLLASKRDSALFSVFKTKLSTEQNEALKFLFAYMPLSDLADYNGDFILANADIALKSRKEAKWGKDIPEDIFLHYVLPFRVNNENLDSFRIVCSNEIAERIKGLDLADAALEINHWCREKVTYQAADIRTSGPLSTMLSARGRCGEESTFTVAALRTAGIPARQVYTPRWAHTDDNHAWVEIYLNGEWYYMGACEPEPVLDRGWFTEPARRAMLVHTKSFGGLYGNENAIISTKNYTDVNNLKKYAITKIITVKVVDANNSPVENALIEYQLYNYAEFYPLAIVPSNSSGISHFETGLGDLLIWAHKDDNFNLSKISVKETDTLILKLDRKIEDGYTLNLDLNVPVVMPPLEGPSAELVKRNAMRLENDNSIRQKYVDSWMQKKDAKNLAVTLKADTSAFIKIIEKSMGNYREISSFLSAAPDSLRPLALDLLEILPEKDLRDSRKSILSDHLLNYVSGFKGTDYRDKFFEDYVLNPRVANEKLISWRHYFQTRLPETIRLSGKENPSVIVQYLNDSILIADDENYYETPLTPEGVFELKVSDKASRAICFVAICRSLGIPSRLEPGSNVPQYFFNDNWIDVYFSDQKHPAAEKGYLRLTSADTKPVPEYYVHFTLARFEAGRYNTLEYDFNKKVTDFTQELALPAGHYMLVTGNRLNDSRILAGISFFDLTSNEHKSLSVNIRKNIDEKTISGHVDIENFSDLTGIKNLSQCCTKDNGMVMIWIDPDKEPSKHIFNDLPILRKEFDSWGGKILFLSDSPFDSSALPGLPANSIFAVDRGMNALNKYVHLNSPVQITSPVVLICDRDGNIIFMSNGYRIGIGQEILKYLL
jgi:transglutaminase-like putative cysteine protease